MFILVGILGIAASAAAFWYCLPRNGRLNPLVGTLAEPYLAIGLTMGFLLSFGAIAAGIITLL